MGKDMQDSANKVKEGMSEGASTLKNKAASKMDDFMPDSMSMNSTRSNMMLWGLAGASAGAALSLFVMKNASPAVKVFLSSIITHICGIINVLFQMASVGGMGGLGAYMGNRYSHRTLPSRGLKK